MNRKTLLIVLGLATVIVIGAAAPALAGPAQRLGVRWFGVGGPRSTVSDVAEILDMTPEEILEAKQGGKTLTEIAEEQGITKEELIDQIVLERTSQIEALVAEGKITREVADAVLANLKDNITQAVERESLGYCLTGEGAGFEGQGCGATRKQGQRQGQFQGESQGLGMMRGPRGGGQGMGFRGAQARGNATTK